jgi:hypothetical protein
LRAAPGGGAGEEAAKDQRVRDQRVLEMAYNLYHRGLSKVSERLSEVHAALAPHGVALSDFKKFRIGWSPADGSGLSGYYREAFIKYPALLERFERLGLIRDGRDTLRGCATFPVRNERGEAEGLVGVDPASGQQCLPPGQEAGGWLFALEKAANSISDYRAVMVAGGVLSFFALYSILTAVGIEATVGLAAPELAPEGLDRLFALGAREVFVLAPASEAGALAGLAAAQGARLHVLPPAQRPEEALPVLEQAAALTSNADLAVMLRRVIDARREMENMGKAP